MALGDYVKARKLGEKFYRQEIVAGRYPYLPALNEMLRNPDTLKQEYLGLMEIPIAFICGTLTKGRQESFAKNYMPLLSDESEFAMKWINLLSHQMNEGIRDPVKAYEFMGRFYISEGNKRVSVLKYLCQPDILADVVRILPPDNNNSEEVKIYSEFLKFFRCTSIYGIYFSGEGRYQKLAELYGQNISTRWPEDIVAELKSEFYTFSRLYDEHTGEHFMLLRGDAFMMYINAYGHTSLMNDSDGTIRTNLGHIWPSHKSILQKLRELYEDISGI